VRKIALAAIVVVIAAVAAVVYRQVQGPAAGRLSTADARAAMRADKLQDIGSAPTTDEAGALSTECPARVHGVVGSAPDSASRVTLWVCNSAAQARGIANDFPASMPGLSTAPEGMGHRPGIDVSAQDNVLVWVAASHPSLAYETAEHLRDLLGHTSAS
jgi:hypothetical protein